VNTRIPIKLEIFASHGKPPGSVSEEQACQMKASHCAFITEALFLVIFQLCEEAARSGEQKFSRQYSNEDFLLAIANLSEIGIAASKQCYREIDRLNLLMVGQSK
jgi:hypothetical protein